MNLDLPPTQRWKHIIPLFKEKLKILSEAMKLQKIEEMGFESVANFFGSLVSYKYSSTKTDIDDDIDARVLNVNKKLKKENSTEWTLENLPEFYQLKELPSYFEAEVEGIASQTSAYGLNKRDVMLLNLGYDFLARCTSCVFEKLDEVAPFHIRAMDWDIPILRDLTINCTFLSRGKSIMKVYLLLLLSILWVLKNVF